MIRIRSRHDHTTTVGLRTAVAVLLVFLPAAVLAQEHDRDPDRAPPALDHGWPVAAPSAVGLDARALDRLARSIADGEHGLVDGFLVVRNGRLVFERYFRGFGPYTLHTLQSVTKSVASTLVGLAVQEGVIDAAMPIREFFPEHRDRFAADGRKRGVTLHHLLTMTSGFGWPELEVAYADTNIVWLLEDAYDWPGYVLQQPMAAEPGTLFNYSTGVSTLLGAILQNETGMRADRFAEHHLFDVLGIPLYGWWRNMEHPDHWVHTGGGLHLMPRDLAKIGYLYINGGKWHGTTVLSPEWIEVATTAHVATGRSPTESYGYQWWLRPLDRSDRSDAGANDIIHAWGWGGQHMFMIPELQMVVVFTGSNFTDSELGGRPIDLLYDEILPAVTR